MSKINSYIVENSIILYCVSILHHKIKFMFENGYKFLGMQIHYRQKIHQFLVTFSHWKKLILPFSNLYKWM